MFSPVFVPRRSPMSFGIGVGFGVIVPSPPTLPNMPHSPGFSTLYCSPRSTQATARPDNPGRRCSACRGRAAGGADGHRRPEEREVQAHVGRAVVSGRDGEPGKSGRGGCCPAGGAPARGLYRNVRRPVDRSAAERGSGGVFFGNFCVRAQPLILSPTGPSPAVWNYFLIGS
jgi:hypothetical protein